MPGLNFNSAFRLSRDQVASSILKPAISPSGSEKKLENFARGVSLYKHPRVRSRRVARSAPAGTFAGRNATRHATHVYEMATYVNSIKVLRGGAHCLPISLPDKPVWCQALLGLVLVALHRNGYQRGRQGLWRGLMLDGLQPIAEA